MGMPSLRMYVDENGNYNLNENLESACNRYLCLTGVVMQKSAHMALTDNLNKLKMNIFGNSNIVLHRREIISGDPPFERLKDDSVREEYNRELLKVMANTKFGVISVLIDKKILVEQYGAYARDPYSLALEYLMQRYQYWIQEACKKRGPYLGDILAEARGKREDQTTKNTYRRIYAGKGYNSLQNANQYYSSDEIKLKKKKDNIAGLQFVDLISHPCRRYILSQKHLTAGTKQCSFEQKIVEILVRSKFRKNNQTGAINGYGTVYFP